MELALLLSLPCCIGPCGCTSLTRQPRPGRRDDGTLERLSVGTCVLCVQLFSDIGKMLIKVFSQLYMIDFNFWVSLGHSRVLFLRVFALTTCEKHLCSIYFLSFSLYFEGSTNLRQVLPDLIPWCQFTQRFAVSSSTAFILLWHTYLSSTLSFW